MALDQAGRRPTAAPGADGAAAPRGLATALALAGGAAILLAVRSPVALHAAVATATLVAAAAWWRARPSYGRSRRLPPGSLAVTRSIEAMVDREFYAREARRHGPIFEIQFHQPVACVVGLERGHELMRRHRESLAPTPLPWNRELRGGFLRYMDDATHEVYGPIFRIVLAGHAVAAAEPATRRAARREIAALAAACADSPVAGVPPGPALDRIVLVAFAHVLFGIEEESPDLAGSRCGTSISGLRSSRPRSRRARARRSTSFVRWSSGGAATCWTPATAVQSAS